MKNLALPHIRAMDAYMPPGGGRDGRSQLLLDFNERTNAPAPAVLEALRLHADSWHHPIQQYPDDDAQLRARIADYAGVGADQVLLCGGSDRGIDLVFRTFVAAGAAVVLPSPSFAMLGQCAQLAAARILRPLYEPPHFAPPQALVLAAIDDDTRLIALCNPNNPTGTAFAPAAIEAVLERAPQALVLVDEAYFEFSGISAVPLLARHHNLVIARTFSKAFGLASLRLGYLLASAGHIAEMAKVRSPFEVGQGAMAAAAAALDALPWMRDYSDEVMRRAMPMVAEFFAGQRIPAAASQANFILFQPPDAAGVVRRLAANGILCRPQEHLGLGGWLRLSIGTCAQMERFILIYRRCVLEGREPLYFFVDRDGTLIYEPQDDFQVDSPDKLRLLDGVAAGLHALQQRGYNLVMISNQDGLGTEDFPQAAFDSAQRPLLRILSDAGVQFRHICICPHRADAGCACRKPGTALVDGILERSGIDRGGSRLCGDRGSDRRCAKNLGVGFVAMPTNGDFGAAIAPLLEAAK